MNNSELYLKLSGYWKGRKAIITGGCGFVGSNLAGSLVDLGAQVTLVDSLVPEYGGNLYNISEIKDRVALNISDVRDKFRLKTLISEQENFLLHGGQKDSNGTKKLLHLF